MLKSFRKRLSQSGSRPNVGRGSRGNSLDVLADRSRTGGHRSADDLDDIDDDGQHVDYDCDSDDPFDSRFDDDEEDVEHGLGPGGSRPATLERRKPLRRLHSASSASAALTSRIDLDSEDVRQHQQKQQQLGFKQRAKNFLLRRRSFGSLDAASQHRVDTGGGGGKPVRIDPRLVRGYAAKRHHSNDCVLDSGSAAGGSGANDRNNNGSEGDCGGGDGSGKKKHHKLFASRSLNFFASMRRSRSREARSGGRGSSTSAASSESGWTDAAGGIGVSIGGGSDIGAGSGSGTLGRRGHRNSEQYMAVPGQRTPHQELPQHHQHQQQQLQEPQRTMSSADMLTSNLNEISGISLERHQLRTELDELFANWPVVSLDNASAWLLGSSGGRKSKRLSMAVGSSSVPYGASSSSPTSVAFNSGSLSRRRGTGTAVHAVGGAGNVVGNLAASSAFSHSTAEQLHLLCRQFNQAVTLRRSYRSKENLAARLQRRSSGNWSGSSGSSSKTAESKSFTKQLSNSTTASKDSALELRFEDDPHAGGTRRPATTPASLASPHSSSSSSHQFAGHQHHQQQRQQHHQQPYNSTGASPHHYQHHQQHQQHKSPPHRTSPQSSPISPWVSPAGYPVSEQHRHRHHQQHHHQSYPRQQLNSVGAGYWNSHQQPQRPSSLNDNSGNAGGSDGANSVPPVPPRRSTSLRNGRGQGGIGAEEQPENGPVSPTYLNQMALAAMAYPQDEPVSTAAPLSSRLDQISESPDESAPAHVPMTSKHQPSMPYRVHKSTKVGQTETEPPPQDPQHSSTDESSVPYSQWRGSLPYPATPPPPRPRQPLLPTSSSSAIATGDSERIVREARAKLSQLNRLSAELMARKQLRPTPQPLTCPFDSLAALESQQSVAGTTNRLSTEGDYVLSLSAATNGSHHAAATSSPHPTAATSPSGHYGVAYKTGGGNVNNNNWRNSLLLQDEAAVRDYLKDLTAVCTTTGCQ